MTAPRLGSLPGSRRRAPGPPGRPPSRPRSRCSRPGLRGRDRRRPGRHCGLHRRLRGAGGGVGQLRGRRRRRSGQTTMAAVGGSGHDAGGRQRAGRRHRVPGRPRSRPRTSRSPNRAWPTRDHARSRPALGLAVLVDPAVAAADVVVIGSGNGGSKLAVPGSVLDRAAGRRGAEGLGSRCPKPTRPGVGPPRRERAPGDSDLGWGERVAEAPDDDQRYLEDRHAALGQRLSRSLPAEPSPAGGRYSVAVGSGARAASQAGAGMAPSATSGPGSRRSSSARPPGRRGTA